MMSVVRTIVAASTVGILTLWSAAPAAAYASAPLTICNQSPVALNVAIGYHSPGVDDPADHSVLTGPFVTRGWGTIDAGACHTYENPFEARYMFWFGFSTQYNNNAIAVGSITSPQGDPTRFCVTDYFNPAPGFTFEAENLKDLTFQTDACRSSGKNIWVSFNMVDTWVNATVNFTGQ
jgi:uncharacterized membrane protein